MSNTDLISLPDALRKMGRLRPIGARDIYAEAADALDASARQVAELQAAIAAHNELVEATGGECDYGLIEVSSGVLDAALADAYDKGFLRARAELAERVADAKAEVLEGFTTEHRLGRLVVGPNGRATTLDEPIREERLVGPWKGGE